MTAEGPYVSFDNAEPADLTIMARALRIAAEAVRDGDDPNEIVAYEWGRHEHPSRRREPEEERFEAQAQGDSTKELALRVKDERGLARSSAALYQLSAAAGDGGSSLPPEN